MTDGPCLSLRQELQQETPEIDLMALSLWLDTQPDSAFAGVLELVANALYRRGRFAIGHEVKHLVVELRA